MRDFQNPAMYIPVAFPRPKKNGATLAPQIPEQEPGADEAAAVEDAGKRRRNESAVAGDGESSRRGRASQALAEMKSAAQQRGLLKTSADPDGRIVTQAATVHRSTPEAAQSTSEIFSSRTEDEDRLPGVEAAAERSETGDEKSFADEAAVDAGQAGPKQIDDASRRERLAVLVDWLTNSIGMSEVFLIDSRGYSLIPEDSESSNADAATHSEQTGTAAALHDLGLRLGGVLELAGRRLSGESSGDGLESSAAGRVARLTLDGDRCLAVAKIGMNRAAERPLLGWIEPLRTPLSDSWVESACEYTTQVLARDFTS
jgi:hypothetical protein